MNQQWIYSKFCVQLFVLSIMCMFEYANWTIAWDSQGEFHRECALAPWRWRTQVHRRLQASRQLVAVIRRCYWAPGYLTSYWHITSFQTQKIKLRKRTRKKAQADFQTFWKVLANIPPILNSQFAHPLLRMLVSARVWCTEGEEDTRGGSRGILQSQTSLTEAISGK